MRNIRLTQTMISKSQSRYKESRFANQWTLNQTFPGTNLILRGLFKSENEIILEDERGNFFLRRIDKVSQSNTDSATASNPVKERTIDLVKIADLHYDERMFQPMKTGDSIDYLFSSDGGIYPGTNYMVIGDPGIGKSTQTLDMLSKISQNGNKRVLFISGEMNQIDMYGYVKRYPSFGQIPTLFLCDYLDDDPKDIIERTLQQGWDVILIDSFIEVQEAVQATNQMNRTSAEKWLIDLMIRNNKGQNENNTYSSFLAIQQVTKGGNFVGSNKLKHNTTGMIELRFSSEFSGDRYAKVTKNRRGFKYEKIYFSLDNPLSVEYDAKRLQRDEEIRQRLQREKDLLLSEEERFNQIFGLNKEETYHEQEL
jgi:predicted ATP-dependent serine protease